jgi:exopolysaccharide biosynthesis polyprenyl glycosylphosphotransferase
MLRRFSINFALFSMAADILSIVCALSAAVWLRPALNALKFVKPLPNTVQFPLSLFIFFPLIWLGIFTAFAIYDGRKYLRVVDEFAALTMAAFVSAIASAGILYLSFRDISRALFLVFVVITFILFFLWRIIARLSFRLQKERPEAVRRVLIVGAGPLGERVQAQINSSLVGKITVVGFLDDRTANFEIPATILLGGQTEILGVVEKYLITDIVIALPHSAYQQMADVVKRLDPVPVKIWIALGFFDLALYKTDIEDFAGIPMLDLRASAIDDYQRMLKRAFDVVFGVLALLVALPVLALIALLIWLDDGRPVLFRQERAGENGRVFKMLKFRTMVRNAEKLRAQVERSDENGNLIHKTKNDPRVTKVGRFLRRFSLDELPQLFNIIGGTMSLVGPRPEIPYLVDKYQPWQRKRFAVPPGLTGWWQVNGRSDRPLHLNTEDDLYYIQNYSIWLDLQIIIRTVWVVLIGKGSY